MFICPRCIKSRESRERVEQKEGKSWLIEYCKTCGFNIEITEWLQSTKRLPNPDKQNERHTPKKQTGWFKSRISDNPDEDR